MSVASEFGSSMYRRSQAINEYREKCRDEMKERLERLRLSVICGEEYLAERKRLYDKWDRMHNYDIPWEESKDEECKGRERDLARDKEEKDDLEQNFETKLQKYVDNFDNSWDSFRLRKGLAPADFATTMDTEDKEKVIQACKNELGTAGQAARQIILEFVNVCALLARPENHITKKSGQHTAKQVSIRTEADMSNEMVRNLTSLPKYTAYAKVLQNEGRNIWKGKIQTRELRAINEGKADASETWHCIQLRARIREEIVERHDRLLDKSGGESRPPPASY